MWKLTLGYGTQENFVLCCKKKKSKATTSFTLNP
jgi:hypothetical protein